MPPSPRTPIFSRPRLNIACSFVRQERFVEATAETRALLDRAYVPWAREVLEAADMGALKVRPEMGGLRDTLAEAARKWGEGLADSVVFVARQRPPLRVPATGEGVFLLNPHQEAYAFLPETGLFRQLTAEDGRVIALARSADRRRITYVTAEKLVRGRASGDVALRGVAIGELTLSTMAASPPLHVEADVRKLEIADGPAGFIYDITSDRLNGWYRRDADNLLMPFPRPPARGTAVKSVRVTPQGVSAAARREPAGCASAVERVGPGGLPQVIVEARGGGSRILGEKLGAGLGGTASPLRETPADLDLQRLRCRHQSRPRGVDNRAERRSGGEPMKGREKLPVRSSEIMSVHVSVDPALLDSSGGLRRLLAGVPDHGRRPAARRLLERSSRVAARRAAAAAHGRGRGDRRPVAPGTYRGLRSGSSRPLNGSRVSTGGRS